MRIKYNIFYSLAVKITILLGLWFVSYEAQAKSPFRNYVNVRFNYSISYPTNFMAEPESADGDGRVFHSKDGRITLTVWGSHSPMALSQTIGELFRQELKSRKSNGHVTYSHLNKSFFVISGSSGKKTFYTKTIVSHGEEKSFDLQYDSSLTPTLKGTIRQISKSFHTTRRE